VVAGQRLLGLEVGRGAWGAVVYFVILSAVALLPPLWSFGRRPRRAAVARLLDQRLRLQDRVATALYCAARGDVPFAAHVMQDAERTVVGLPVAVGFPLRWTKVWRMRP